MRRKIKHLLFFVQLLILIVVLLSICVAYGNKPKLTKDNEISNLSTAINQRPNFTIQQDQSFKLEQSTKILDHSDFSPVKSAKAILKHEGQLDRSIIRVLVSCSVGNNCAAGSYCNSGGTCSLCTAGYMCPGDSLRYACPGGTNAAGTGTSMCAVCNAGEYGGGTTCTSCSSVTYGYCLSGQNSYQSCPGNFFRQANSGGQTSFGGGCSTCGGGSRTYSNPTQCDTSCQPSNYCLGGTDQTVCPPGTFSSAGQTFAATCNDCADGMYTNPGATSCRTCAAGGYCKAGAGRFLCPAGRYTSSTGLSSVTVCTNTVLGSYSLAGATSSAACPAGYICPTTTALLVVPAGYSQGQVFRTSVTDCAVCPAAQYSNGTASACSPCPLGAYCPGGTNAIRCPPGHISSTTSSSTIAVCTVVSNGFYTVDRVTSSSCTAGGYCPGQNNMIPCPAGTFSGTMGNAVTSAAYCQVTAAGFYTPAGSTLALTCEAGYYCPGGSDQIPCPNGFYSSESGAVTSSSCLPCPTGMGTVAPGSAQCTICLNNQYCLPTSTVVNCPDGHVHLVTLLNANPTACTPCSPGAYAYGSDCVPCAIGSYCPGGVHNIVPCPSGTIGVDMGYSALASCSSCTAGKYSTLGATGCWKCPVGHYCPGRSDKIPCSAGYVPSSPNTVGALNSLVCDNVCGPGEYTTGVGEVLCMLCPLGHYCPGASNAVKCPAGYIRTSTMATALSDCVACEAGSYSNAGDAFCLKCPPGHYCPGKSNKIPCGNGFYSAATSAVAVGTCQPCAPGYYTTTTSAAVCLKCPGGGYCPGGASNFVPCPAGKKSSAIFANTVDTCTPCFIGSYSAAGSVFCSTCPSGYYCPGDSDKLPCPAGYISTSVGETTSNTCVACAVGKFSQPGGTYCMTCPTGYYCLGSGDKTPCPAGKVNANTGSQNAVDCVNTTAGTYSPEGSTFMIGCRGGSYCPGGSNLIPCAAGKYSNAYNAPVSSTCVDCAAGTYSASGSLFCSNCPAGSYCPGASNAIPCPLGSFSSSGASICTSCAAGKTTFSGAISALGCFDCPVGYYCPYGQVQVACQAGYASNVLGATNSTVCVACAIGSISATEGSTSCTACVAPTTTFSPGSTVCLVRPTSQPSSQPSRQPSVQPSSQPSRQPSRQPTCQPSRQPSSRPSAQPSRQPSRQPSGLPSSQPSRQPTLQPTRRPSAQPSFQPSMQPSLQPTAQPSYQPSSQPSSQPTQQPVSVPSSQPTSRPSNQPSSRPSVQPSMSPTEQPSGRPSTTPSALPSISPNVEPTSQPSSSPSTQPTSQPNSYPSAQPSSQPTVRPSCVPSSHPSLQPSSRPSSQPSGQPAATPSMTPTSQPSSRPSMVPSNQPSGRPSCQPSTQPTNIPSTTPSSYPSTQPTTAPSSRPSSQPSGSPSKTPTSSPSTRPSTQPSTQPSTRPTSWPTNKPTSMPSTQPSGGPSCCPSIQPYSSPSSPPTGQPSSCPSSGPSIQPSSQPSNQPFTQSTGSPTCQPTCRPTSKPTSQHSKNPTLLPTDTPSMPPAQSGHPTEPATEPAIGTAIGTAAPTSLSSSVSPSATPSAQSSVGSTAEHSECPSISSTASPTHSGTMPPTASVAKNIGLNVVGCSQGNGNSNNASGASSFCKFKVVLPFLKTTGSSTSSTNHLTDIVFHTHQTVQGNSFIVLGDSHLPRDVVLSTGVAAQTAPVSFVVSQVLVVSYDYSGRSVSNAGDINGDGVNDLIIGVPYAARCYVLFGTAEGFVNMTQGFTIFGAQSSDLTGWSVSGAGDVNNDTLADIIIGAPYAYSGNNIGSGAVYVVYGKRTGLQDINVLTMTPEQGFTIFGSGVGDTLGVSVSGAGDVNGDGHDDIVIGALKGTLSYRGGAYVVYGSNLRQRSTLYVSSLKPQEGFAMVGPVWSYSGYSVSGAGDVNGDKVRDVLIGSVPFKTTFGTQLTYLVYGNRNPLSQLSLPSLTASQGAVISGGGVVVSGVGDINHDGYDDIMIGSNYGFSGGGYFVWTNVTDSAQAVFRTPAPSLVPTTRSPSRVPTRAPTTWKPSTQPTLHPTGPSLLPTEAPTGPTSQPSSTPTIVSAPPTSFPSSNQPTSCPSLNPVPHPTARPSVKSERPSRRPSLVSAAPTVQQTNIPQPNYRSRNPLLRIPSASPSAERNNRVVHIIVGGHYDKQQQGQQQDQFEGGAQYVIDTNEPVHITGYGALEGDIYTVLPQVNGSLHIEIFNNITDKLNLTSHNTIHSMSDLVITRGSVIITFPTTGQRIRLANLTPLDISENNFMFSNHEQNSDGAGISKATQTVITAVSAAFCISIVLFVAFLLFRRGRQHKKKLKEYKEGIIALEDNPTRLIIAVNDMYAHFDAYIPNNTQATGNSDQQLVSNNSVHISHESKSTEGDAQTSPLSSFEQRLNAILRGNDQSVLGDSSGILDSYNYHNNANGSSNNNSESGSNNSSFISMDSDILNDVLFTIPAIIDGEGAADMLFWSEAEGSQGEVNSNNNDEYDDCDENVYYDDISMDSQLTL